MLRNYPLELLLFLGFIFLNLNSHSQNEIDWAVDQLLLLSPGEYEVLRRYEKLPQEYTVQTGSILGKN
ncbi:MAG: hypothetical protein JZU47_00490 [Prolixibacteraceae bacterium]|nr:hypothetical protein [Prolixibacteraceae bacterium]